MEKIKAALGSAKWWLGTGLAMGFGWALAFALARVLIDKDVGVLSTLLVGAPAAFAGRFAGVLLDE